MKNLILLFILFAFISCKKNKELPPIDNAVDLDGTKINDSSLLFPAKYLLSAAIPNPTATDLEKPVVIAAHGFTATCFEWVEFSEFATTKGDFYVSRVLLGAHGRDYKDFKTANWEEWQRPIIEEYNKLQSMGYKNISLAGASTGCPLILNMIRENKINTSSLKHVFFVDPIILPSAKILSLSPLIGPAVGYIEVELDPGENGYWYKYRPQHPLRELEKLIRGERKKLERGVDLPAGVDMIVFKAERDGSADPASAVLLKKGITKSDGGKIDVRMIDSDIHVFTRLRGKKKHTATNITQQQEAFETIYKTIK